MGAVIDVKASARIRWKPVEARPSGLPNESHPAHSAIAPMPEINATMSCCHYRLVVVRGGILYSEMVLKWCEESARTLDSLRELDAKRGRTKPSPAAVTDK